MGLGSERVLPLLASKLGIELEVKGSTKKPTRQTKPEAARRTLPGGKFLGEKTGSFSGPDNNQVRINPP
jgi:hypothetical protein